MSKAPDTVGEIMSRDVVTVSRDDPVEVAVRAMVSRDISSVVIAEEGRPLGVFTERDLTRRILDDPDLPRRRVGDVMSSPAITIEPQVQMVEAFDLMNARGIRRLAVVEGGRLVGIVTERDLVRWVSQVAAE